MNKEYKAHPLMIFSFIKPLLFALAIPLATAVLRYLTDRKLTNILALEVFTFSAIILIGIARCLTFRLILRNDMLTIKSGVILMRTAQIKLSRISSVQTERNPIDMIFRSVTFRINTEAGSLKQSDFKFKLKHRDSTEISEFLYSDKTVHRVRFSAVRVAIMAAATSSAATGMIIGVPIIHRIGQLLGIGLEQMLLDEINNVSNKFQNYFPPIVNTVTLIILLAYTTSFVYSFIKHINFKLSFGEESLVVRSGFFVRIKTAFKRSRVNNVKIEQTLIMRLIKRYSMKVSIGGFDDAKSVSQVVVPSGKRRTILQEFYEYFPFLLPDGNLLRPERKLTIKNRFLFWPALYLLLTTAVAIYSSLRFPDFDRLIQFLTLVMFGVILCYAFTCLYEYRYGSLKLGENVFAQSNRFFSTREFYCPKKNIGQIKITRFPLDIHQGICRIRLTICSENADSVRVRFLNYEQATEEINNCFNLGCYFNSK